MRGPGVCADGFLEGLDLGSKDELLRFDDLLDLGAKTVSERVVLRLQIEQRDVHGRASWQ